MTQPSLHLPELAEADAPPQIATIYGELRRLSAVPMVALIWRHLATRPGVLEEAWSALRPQFVAGAVQHAAWTEAKVAADPARLDAAALASAGLDADSRAAFARVLDAYNRANPVNFIAVRMLVHRARSAAGENGRPPSAADDATTSATRSHAWAPPAAIGPLPPMAALSAFTSEQRRLVDDLSSDPAVDRATVVPSLYRHLVGWPDLIAAIHAQLAPRFRSGEMRRLIGDVAARMDRRAEALARNVPPLPTLAADAAALATLTRFSTLIPEMVTVGVLLRQGMEP